MTSTSTLCWQQLCRLERITDKYPAIPVGLNGGKAPMLKGWQRHPGFGIRELSDFKGIQAVGIRTNPLLCFDFDGISAVNFAKDKGLFPDSLECWRINRDTSQSRFKLIFEPTKQQLMKLPGSEFTGKSITGEREALEIFIHTGRQVIVMGNPQLLPVPLAEIMHRSSPQGASSINCWHSVGSLISGTAASTAGAGLVITFISLFSHLTLS